jgi:capsid protein
MVSYDDVFTCGYFNRPDSTRGVTPLSVAINTVLDIAENHEYALLKAKHHAMLGVFIKRAALSQTGEWDYSAGGGEAAGGETSADSGDYKPAYQFDLKPGLKLEGLPGDDISLLESRQPSSEWQAFMEQATRIVLLSLDIPYTFYDSRQSSYTVSRQDMIQYMVSCREKRQDNKDMLDEITEWHFEHEVDRGVLRLPGGMKASGIRFDWIPTGVPWMNPLQEVEADLKAIQGGLTSRQEVCLLRGKNFFDIVDQLAEEEAYAKEMNITMVTASPNSIVNAPDGGADAPNQPAKENPPA